MLRLRQVALVAHDLDAAVDELCGALAVTVCHRDPGVAEFGLHNALVAVGDQFIEIVTPTVEGTTAGRLLDKRNGDGGYMVLYEVDDLDERLERLDALGVRIVWAGDFASIRGRHLHPRDVGGTIVSIDQPNPGGSWAWAGPDWSADRGTSVVSAIAGIRIGAEQPTTMRRRWAELGLDAGVAFDDVSTRGEGIDGLDLVASDRRRAGESFEVCGVTVRLV